MINQREFDIEYLKLIYEQKLGEVRRAEDSIYKRKRYLIHKHENLASDEQLLLLQHGYGILRGELDSIKNRLSDLGVQMEITRSKQRTIPKREKDRETERNRIEGMMRGNYSRYNGEDI